MSTEKSRYWTFVVYPDSAPENWRELLADTHVSLAISPLHGQDLNMDGEMKKAHYHVLAQWDGPTTLKNAQRTFGSVPANGVVQVVASARGMYRYLTHLDNPEKFQYNPAEIQHLNGFNPCDLISETDKNNIKWDIGHLIIEYNITEYNDLVELLFKEGMRDYYAVLTGNVMHFSSFIKSRKYAIQKQKWTAQKKKNIESA